MNCLTLAKIRKRLVVIGTMTILNVSMAFTCFFYPYKVLTLLGLNNKVYIWPFVKVQIKKNPYSNYIGIKISNTILLV